MSDNIEWRDFLDLLGDGRDSELSSYDDTFDGDSSDDDTSDDETPDDDTPDDDTSSKDAFDDDSDANLLAASKTDQFKMLSTSQCVSVPSDKDVPPDLVESPEHIETVKTVFADEQPSTSSSKTSHHIPDATFPIQPPAINLPFTNKKDIKWTANPFSSKLLNKSSSPEISTTRPTHLVPIEYFMKYFPEAEFEKMAKFTNIYARQNNIKNYVDTTSAEMKVFVGLHLLLAVFQNSEIRMYWASSLCRMKLITDSMSYDRFFLLRSCFHVIDNNDIAANNVDKFVKVRPLFNSFLNRCKQLPVETNVAIDEKRITFKPVFRSRLVGEQPIPLGIKQFLLCSSKGMVYNMILYQESTTELNSEMEKKYGLGGAVVLKLVENLEKYKHYLFFNKFFSSYNLLTALDYLKIKAAGPVKLHRFGKPPVLSNKKLTKLGRGASFEVSTFDKKIGLIKWLDNKPKVYASNFITSGRPEIVKQYDDEVDAFYEIECPEIVKLYKNSICGVHFHDYLISLCRVFPKSRKWTLRILFHSFDMATCNSWLEYKIDAKANNLQQKNIMNIDLFKQKLAESLILAGKKQGYLEPTKQPAQNSAVYELDPPYEVRKDLRDHLPNFDGSRDPTFCKLAGCSNRTHVICVKCNVHLCLTRKRNCFYDYHH